jgi:hypothetical protein
VSGNTTIYLIAAVAALGSLAAWVGLVVVPAWTSYSRWWEKLIATVLSVYVLAAFLALGGGLGAFVLYNYDRI